VKQTTHSHERMNKQYSTPQLMRDIAKLLDEGHTVTLLLGGYSMRPFLENERDKALLTKVTHLQKGDVVLAEAQKDFFVLHRIIKIEGSNITLRGDGNLHKEFCTTADVKGFAVGFYRKGSDKLEKTNGIKWKIYSWLWELLFPIRRYLLFIYRIIND